MLSAKVNKITLATKSKGRSTFWRLLTKSTELNMFSFGDNVDGDKLLNWTLSPVCTDGRQNRIQLSATCSCASGDWNPAHRPRFDLQSLHWLPVRQRVTFKLATLQFTSAWTAEHQAIWPTTSVLPAAVVLVHGQPPVWCWTSLVRRRHWETEHLPSPDRVSGTAFLLPSVIRHCRCQSSESCWKLVCLRVAALVTYELAPWKCTD